MTAQEEKRGVLHVKHGEYLGKIFQIMRAQSSLALSDKNMTFKNTELRMLSEILSAECEGKRLISTQLATRLGVTRSAISQIVAKLEEEGVIERVPDAVDRKIAYITISDQILERYSDDIMKYTSFIDEVIVEFGNEKFNQMYELFLEFAQVLQEKVQREKKNR